MKRWFRSLAAVAILSLSIGQGCPGTAPMTASETPIERAHRICTEVFFMSESSYQALEDVVRLDLSRGITRRAEVASALSGCDECGDNWCHSACSDCALAIIDAIFPRE